MAYHSCRPAVFLAWVLGLVLCSSGVGSEPEVNGVEHEPPMLKPVRWQQLEKCYQDVFIDGSGRAWFFCTTPNHVARPKWAYLVCPELPDKTIQLAGVNVPLGFDSHNRFWDIGKLGLCCTDVHRDTFFERRPVGLDKLHAWERGGELYLPFARFMFEHSSGRLYFLDANGVHTLDGGQWLYQKLSPPLQYSDPLAPRVRIVEGPVAEVYLWSPVGHVYSVNVNFNGVLWVHEGTAWKHYTGKDHPALGAMTDVFPQPDGTIHVQIQPGHEVSVTLPDRTPPPMVLERQDPQRDARNERFCQPAWERSRLADYTGEELAAYGRFLAKDAHGRVYFWSTGGRIDGGVAVFQPQYQEDVPTLKYERFPLDNYSHTARLDSEGRLWARLRVKDQPFLSRYDGGWTHFADPTGWTPDRHADRVLIYRDGEFWSMVTRHASEWRGSMGAAARDVPGMANPGFLQSLRNGAMVASERGSFRAYLFDGRQWTVYGSLREMVENRYAWLREHLDNTARAYFHEDYSISLGCDATARVWLIEDKFSGAYDGNQWGEIPVGSFRMNAAGDRVTSGGSRPGTGSTGSLYDSSVWPPKGLTALPRTTGAAAWFDHHGRAWTTGDSPYFVYRCSVDRFAKIESSTVSLPLLEDSAGRFWLREYEGWCLLLPDGQTSEQCFHPVTMDAPVIEQGHGVFWAFASDGLLRFHVEEPKDGKPKIVIDEHFPRLLPQGDIEFLGLDKHDNLWMATSFGKSGLYRIELPPPEGAKP